MYIETKVINNFIAKMPKASVSYSAQSMIKELHTFCMNLDVIDNTEAMLSLKNAINTLGE